VKIGRSAPLLVASAWLVGCTATSLDGIRLTDVHPQTAVFFVRRHAEDTRNLDQIIAARMIARGISATTTAPDAGYDYLVTYIDRWHWDMRMYLIDMRIDVRDGRSNVLVATGRSFQTSLSAMGQTHTDIIDKVVRVIIEGPPNSTDPDTRSAEQLGQQSR
jgi:hypothetical protein